MAQMSSSLEFNGTVYFNERGELACFCSQDEVLRGQCVCKNKYDCPDAVLNIDIIPGTKPSEKGIKNIVEVKNKLEKEVGKIKEGLAQLEKAVRKSKFKV